MTSTQKLFLTLTLLSATTFCSHTIVTLKWCKIDFPDEEFGLKIGNDDLLKIDVQRKPYLVENEESYYQINSFATPIVQYEDSDISLDFTDISKLEKLTMVAMDVIMTDQEVRIGVQFKDQSVQGTILCTIENLVDDEIELGTEDGVNFNTQPWQEAELLMI